MKRIKTALIILLLLLVVTVPCSAEESNYIISGKDKIPVSTSYINEAAISDFQGTLNSAQDIFIDENDKMYIADTGNNRVVVAKTDGTVLSVITSADGIELKGPEGVYADNFGSIFVADTGNERILHFSSGGKYIESFLRPESDYLGETYLFNPSKIVVNSTGYIYTLKSQTIMTVDANNRFRGYLGQPDVGFNLSETLIRMFASAEQIKAIKKREAEPYINIDIGKDGLIYATSREIGSEIKVLNSVGENLYRTSTASSRNIFQKITGTFFSLFNIGNYAAKGFQFGENTIVGGKQTAPSFADIAVDNNGIITVINSINNILYQYDSEGNLLFSFGKEEADSGKIELPSSIAVDSNGKIYLVDAVQNHILVYKPTEFAEEVHKAVTLYNDGDYNAAYDLWASVLEKSENYELAQIGMGKALYKEKRYYEAMQQYKNANERSLYSQAFAKYRHSIFRKNFGFAIPVILAIILLLFFVFKLFGKFGKKGERRFEADFAAEKKSLGEMNLLSFNMIFHPIDTIHAVKENRNRLNILYCGFAFLIIILLRIGSLYLTSYPLMTADTGNISIGLEFLKLGLPVATWGISVFFVTSVMDGESKLNEVYTCCIYSMMPFVIFTPVYTAMSYVLSQNEAGFYNALQAFMWIWIIVLLVLCVNMLNNYSFGKTIGVCIISLLVMALIWAIGFLFIAIVSEVWKFVSEIGTELRMLV